MSFLEKESESQLISQSGLESHTPTLRPSPSGTRAVTAIPARMRDSPLHTSPLATSTPQGNAMLAPSISTPILANPLLMNARGKEGVPSGSDEAR